jgi:hypothetical protein
MPTSRSFRGHCEFVSIRCAPSSRPPTRVPGALAPRATHLPVFSIRFPWRDSNHATSNSVLREHRPGATRSLPTCRACGGPSPTNRGRDPQSLGKRHARLVCRRGPPSDSSCQSDERRGTCCAHRQAIHRPPTRKDYDARMPFGSRRLGRFWLPPASGRSRGHPSESRRETGRSREHLAR